ncbi:AI-2E family transporter [Falsiroseomonas oryzae]|uniref:AI-2E family transporter n=1 Tax=Falsiroseomonas oryzae TaxID=2766473 RepID=UPI0022EB600B|nr:AI-2E family transporter [Roseomonas sp. MO-31]
MDQQQPGPGPGAMIERGLAFAAVAAVLFGILAVLRPFATAIMFGAILAIALWPLRDALVTRRVRPGLTAALLLLLVLAAVVVPTLLIAPGLVAAIDGGMEWARVALLTAPDAPPEWLARLPLVGEQVVAGWAKIAEARGNLGGALAPYAARIQAVLLDIAGGLADSLLQMLLSLVVATMLWTSGPVIAEALHHGAGRLGGETGQESLTTAGAAVRAVAYGVVGTSVAQGIFAGIGYAIAGIPAAALLGFLTFVFSISQILGPLVILMWIGAAWWLFDQGQTLWAIFMAAWGLVVISGSDNVLRPLLIKRGVEMPLSIIIIGVFGGFVAFGFLGLFIGPVLLAVGLVMLRAWRAASPGAA